MSNPSLYLATNDDQGSGRQLKAANNGYNPGGNPIGINQIAYQQAPASSTTNQGYPSLYQPTGTQPYYPNQPQRQVPQQAVSSNQLFVPNQAVNKISFCQFCKVNTENIYRQKAGCATYGWAVALCVLTGCCCWIPFVIDDCFDK